MKRQTIARFIALALAAGSVSASAQFGGLGGLGNVLKAVPIKAPSSLLSGPEPVSTNIRDAVYGDPSKDGWTPPVRAAALTSLQRTPTGGFVLRPGYYEMNAQSYCLHAGTHGPGGGDGYLFAPVKGAARDAVISILQNSVAHPEIDQHQIQLLLWAIVARAKFEDLSTELKAVAARLLTTKQLASLNRNALSVLTNSQLASALGGYPPGIRQVMEAEGRMRSLLATPNMAYSEMERVAVLTGKAPRGEGSIDTPSGRWSRHPDGYWIRFIPSGYQRTLVQIWVASGDPGIGKTYDPGNTIAVPGNTARQRLAQSGRPVI